MSPRRFRRSSHPAFASARAGLSVFEMVVTVAILGIISSGALELSVSGHKAYNTGINVTDLEIRATRSIERLVREIGDAQAGSLNPPDPAGTSMVEFITPESVVGSVVQWGPTVRFVREMEANETDNGLDDDGDGLVDEGQLVRIEDPGGPEERRTVLARGVARMLQGELANASDDNGNGLIDEEGFAISIESGNGMTAVTLQLTVEAMAPSGLIQRTVQTAVTLRN